MEEIFQHEVAAMVESLVNKVRCGEKQVTAVVLYGLTPDGPEVFDVTVAKSKGPSLGSGIVHTPERAHRSGDSQDLPTVNDLPFIQDAVIADIDARKQVGIRRYGTALQPFNGRDALLDAYEEALDLAIYLKQALVERDTADPS